MISAPFPRVWRSLSALLFVASFFLPALRVRAEDAPQPQSIACPVCRGDGHCHVRGCQEGKIPCPATCIKKDDPGWTQKKVEGFPDDTLWLVFKSKDGKNNASWSQAHIGELIEYEKGNPVNRGRCPKCEGTSRVTCPTCKGANKCFACEGAGKFVRNQNLFTLTDSEGRAMEAIVRVRRGDKITVMRLPDQKIFELPLDKLSAESTERIEQRFPAAR